MTTSEATPEVLIETIPAPRSYWQRVLSYDEALLVRVRKWEVPWVTRVMRSLTQIGNAPTWWALGIGLAAVGGSARRPALLLGGAAVLGTAASQIIKRTATRPRPNPQVLGFSALAEHPDRFSFPSGHTTAAVAVAVALAGEGVYLGPAAMALAVGIATSRVYLGAHYPLDVVAGAALGSVAGLVVRSVIG